MRKVCVISLIASFFAFIGEKAISPLVITYNYFSRYTMVMSGTGMAVQKIIMPFSAITINNVATYQREIISLPVTAADI